jgi:hypothetical protein
MVAHTYNPSTQKVVKEDREFEASLDYIARPYLKTPRVEDVAQ